MSTQNKTDYEWKKNIKFMMITIPLYMGFASMKNLQRQMKESTYTDSFTFSIAYSFLYMGNMLMRIFHNYIWVFTKPFWRIIISCVIMIINLIVLMILQTVEWNPNTNNSWICFLTFGLGGISVGTFGSNYLNLVSLISPGCRFFAVLGVPIGMNIVNIFSFLLIQLFEKILSERQVIILIYMIIMFFVLVTMSILLVYVTHGPFIERQAVMNVKNADDVYTNINIDVKQIEEQANKLTTSGKYFWLGLKHFKQWAPSTLPNSVAWMAHTFAATQFSPGVVLYSIHSTRNVSLFGIDMSSNYFRAILASFALVFDFGTRIFAEKLKMIFSVTYVYLDLVGILFVLSGISELVIFGDILISISGGFLYLQSSKWIREATEHTDFNLMAFSIWFMLGDLGNCMASFSQQKLVESMCIDMKNKLKNTSWDPCPYYNKE